MFYETYFNGAQRDSIVTSFSVAKSFVSALIGVAIKGRLHQIASTIRLRSASRTCRERDERFNQITLRHLLLMASGLEYRNFGRCLNGDDPLTTYYPDQRQLALENTHHRAAGTAFPIQ